MEKLGEVNDLIQYAVDALGNDVEKAKYFLKQAQDKLAEINADLAMKD